MSTGNTNVTEVQRILEWSREKKFSISHVTVGDVSISLVDLDEGLLGGRSTAKPTDFRTLDEKWADELGMRPFEETQEPLGE